MSPERPAAEAAFHSILIRCAREAGFPLAGALDLDLARGPMAAHLERYDRWLAQGHEGAMSYLRRGRERRADPRRVFQEARSILCVAQPYPAEPAGSPDPAQGPRYSRYLRRRDYHGEMADRLEQVMDRVVAVTGDAGLRWKTCVDTSAVLERSWASLAGLGWIGKNTLLIHPRHGSYLFLGEVLINRETGAGPRPVADYCGNCTRCLKSCPTQALIEPRTLDSNRCISYWTLEKRGEFSIGSEGRSAIGPWIAGCDLCQEACPFNIRPARAAGNEPPPPDLRSHDGATALREWKELLEETPGQYQARTRDSALSRVKSPQFSRNLAITLANALTSSSRADGIPELKPLIARRLREELDPAAAAEWKRCWNSLLEREAVKPPG